MFWFLKIQNPNLNLEQSGGRKAGGGCRKRIPNGNASLLSPIYTSCFQGSAHTSPHYSNQFLMNVLTPLSSSAMTTNERILSSGRLPNVRRPALMSLERRQRNKERFKQLLDEPTDEDI